MYMIFGLKTEFSILKQLKRLPRAIFHIINEKKMREAVKICEWRGL